MRQKAIVFEVNETPLKVFRRFQLARPGSNLDRLMKSSLVLETKALDVDESFLYPSQTWASLNSGAPFASHKIHWYNDPKPDQFPMFWRAAAEGGKSVGLVNTLHSSPAESYAGNSDHYKFVIPDCFAVDSYTKPAYLEPFQALNLKAVNNNSRVTQVKAPLREAALTVMNSPRYGIKLRTLFEGASMVSQILRKKVNRERLRNLQFPLVADIFFKLYKQHQPDLAVLFTNHVAANMHRYWYALFPEDYSEKVYNDQWVERYRGEIMAAVDLLDIYLGRLMKLAEDTDRILVIVSSMGQHANPKLTAKETKENSHTYWLKDITKLVEAATESKHSFKAEQAMFPQFTLEFRTPADAQRCFDEVHAGMKSANAVRIYADKTDLNGNFLTLSVGFVNAEGEQISLRGKNYSHAELGFQKIDIDDHHSGCHCPEGSLLIYNSRTAEASSESINYLEYAPALLELYGVPKRPHMMTPTFSF